MSPTLLGLLLLGAAPSLVDEERCEAHRKDPFCGSPAAVWCDESAKVELQRLAQHAAPILWFSPDEPLLPRPVVSPEETGGAGAQRPGIPLPQPLRVVHPGVYRGETQGAEMPPATVYWHISRMLTFDGQQTAAAGAFGEGQLLVSGVRTLVLTYAFYYERDEGLNPHYNDLEGMEIQIDFDREENGRRRYRASVARVTGLGHGSALLSNILQVRRTVRHTAGAPDVTLPITILVEEGKHASAPDRNGDGTYTPGYDVNIKVPDAWGVRDVFGSGVVASSYRESMTKPRRPGDRIGPDPAWFTEGPIAPAQCFATPAGLVLPKRVYQLERFPRCGDGGASVAFCDDLEALKSVRPDLSARKEFYEDTCLGGRIEWLQKEMAEAKTVRPCKYLNMLHVAERFPERPGQTGFPLKYHYGDDWYLQPFRYLAPAARMDGNTFGPAVSAFVPFGLPKFAGWFTARAALVRAADEWSWRVDLSYSPSIARLFDWYVAAGYDWGVPDSEVERESDANGEPSGEPEGEPEEPSVRPVTRRGWAVEGGLQVRHHAWWLRLGLRSPVSAGRFGTTRFVAELGFGPQPRHARVH